MASSAESGDGDPPTEVGPATEQTPVPQGSVTSVRVAVRIRPLVSMETAAGCQECMFGDCDNNQARERVEKMGGMGEGSYARIAVPCTHVSVLLCLAVSKKVASALIPKRFGAICANKAEMPSKTSKNRFRTTLHYCQRVELPYSCCIFMLR